jgi:DNA repair protein RadC
LFEVEVGSVSRKELESIKIKPFNFGLERDLSFTPKNAEEVFKGLLSGKTYAKGGKLKYEPSRDIVAIAIKDGPFTMMFTKGDFLGGAYQMEKGGSLENYLYVSPRKIIFARLKSGEDIKPINGFYIRKDASGTVITGAASKPLKKANLKSLKISIPRPILLTGSPSKSPKMMKFIGTFSGKDPIRPAMSFVQVKEGSIVATDANKLIRIIDGSTLNEDKLVCESRVCKDNNPKDQKFPNWTPIVNSFDSQFSESYDMVDLYEALMQVRNDDLKNKVSKTLRVIELKLENVTIYFNITLLLQCVKGCLLLGWKKAFISYSSAEYKAVVFTEENVQGRLSSVSLIMLMPIFGSDDFEKVTITPKALLEQGGMMGEGAETMIQPTILQNNPNALVGTNTMYEMFADGGMMAKGGIVFYEGQSVMFPLTKNTRLDRSVKNLFNQYANKELVIGKIESGKPYDDAEAFVKSTGEKLPFTLTLNPKYLFPYKDGGVMAKGGGVTYKNLLLEKPSIVNETKIQSERFKINEIDLFRKTQNTFSGSPIIRSSADSVKIFREFWDEQSLTIYESFNVMLLNQANKVIGLYQHSKGGVTGTVADAEMVVLSAVKSLAKGVIISHNHPSGNLTPSQADIEMTNKIKNGLKILGVQLLDSIIITENEYYSFADEGIMALGGMTAHGGMVDNDEGVDLFEDYEDQPAEVQAILAKYELEDNDYNKGLTSRTRRNWIYV